MDSSKYSGYSSEWSPSLSIGKETQIPLISIQIAIATILFLSWYPVDYSADSIHSILGLLNPGWIDSNALGTCSSNVLYKLNKILLGLFSLSHCLLASSSDSQSLCSFMESIH